MNHFIDFFPVVFASIPSLWAIQPLGPGPPGNVMVGLPLMARSQDGAVIGSPLPQFLHHLFLSPSGRQDNL